MSMKNPLTPAGIEPATFRFVAQHLNHFATAVPTYINTVHILQDGIQLGSKSLHTKNYNADMGYF